MAAHVYFQTLAFALIREVADTPTGVVMKWGVGEFA